MLGWQIKGGTPKILQDMGTPILVSLSPIWGCQGPDLLQKEFYLPKKDPKIGNFVYKEPPGGRERGTGDWGGTGEETGMDLGTLRMDLGTLGRILGLPKWILEPLG